MALRVALNSIKPRILVNDFTLYQGRVRLDIEKHLPAIKTVKYLAKKCYEFSFPGYFFDSLFFEAVYLESCW